MDPHILEVWSHTMECQKLFPQEGWFSWGQAVLACPIFFLASCFFSFKMCSERGPRLNHDMT